MVKFSRFIQQDALLQSLLFHNFGNNRTITLKSGNHFVIIGVSNAVSMGASDGIMMKVDCLCELHVSKMLLKISWLKAK